MLANSKEPHRRSNARALEETFSESPHCCANASALVRSDVCEILQGLSPFRRKSVGGDVWRANSIEQLHRSNERKN